jgi:type VI secretion system lysozyme-like protein
VAGPKPVAGARALLFDRLIDNDPSSPYEAQPRRTLDAAGLRASVAAELDRLLNTRAPIAADEVARRPRSTINYGIPDLSYFRPGGGGSQAELVRLIEQTIAAFEPRLLSPRATIVQSDERREAMTVEVAGKLAIGTVMEAVTFALPVPGTGESTEDPDG